MHSNYFDVSLSSYNYNFKRQLYFLMPFTGGRLIVDSEPTKFMPKTPTCTPRPPPVK